MLLMPCSQYQLPLTCGDALKLNVVPFAPLSFPAREPNGADSVPSPPLESMVMLLAKSQPNSAAMFGARIGPLKVQLAVKRMAFL